MNKFLFVDFGASRVKTIEYDIKLDRFSSQHEVESPFLNKETIHKPDLLSFLHGILERHTDARYVIPCTILGGGYDGEVYYSWKVNTHLPEKTCLISGLFTGETSYHVHADHMGLVGKLTFLGKINQHKFYSSLGDTDCVKRSFVLSEDECIVNLGTGSQVIKLDNIIKYIPSGRALNCYQSFFQDLGVDLFERFSNITVDQLIQSTLLFDLNIFEQAFAYVPKGGMVSNIHEKTFSVDNFIRSLFRSYLDQYLPYISDSDQVYLTGGIARKFPVIEKYFEVKTNKKVTLRSSHLEDTFIGIRNKLIEDYEYINNRG
jgi:hypothetical protein